MQYAQAHPEALVGLQKMADIGAGMAAAGGAAAGLGDGPVVEAVTLREQTAAALDSYNLPELDYFREHFLDSFRLTLDEME